MESQIFLLHYSYKILICNLIEPRKIGEEATRLIISFMMVKKIITIISLLFLVLILISVENNKQRNALLAVQNNQITETEVKQTVASKTNQNSKISKRSTIPIIKPGVNTSINYYPNNKLSEKTTDYLLTLSAATIIVGLCLLELESLIDMARFLIRRANFAKNFFRFINRIL